MNNDGTCRVRVLSDIQTNFFVLRRTQKSVIETSIYANEKKTHGNVDPKPGNFGMWTFNIPCPKNNDDTTMYIYYEKMSCNISELFALPYKKHVCTLVRVPSDIDPESFTLSLIKALHMEEYYYKMKDQGKNVWPLVVYKFGILQSSRNQVMATEEQKEKARLKWQKVFCEQHKKCK